jgi:hypothetical protein
MTSKAVVASAQGLIPNEVTDALKTSASGSQKMQSEPAPAVSLVQG